MSIRLIAGDCRAIMPNEGPFDLIVADPPYGGAGERQKPLCRGGESGMMDGFQRGYKQKGGGK